MIIATLVGAIGTFVGSIAAFRYERYIAAKTPKAVSINAGTKKCIFFIIRYLLPAGNLMFLYITFSEVTVRLVFLISFLFCILVFNLCDDMIVRFVMKKHHANSEAIQKTLNLLHQTVELGTLNTNFIQKLKDEIDKRDD